MRSRASRTPSRFRSRACFARWPRCPRLSRRREPLPSVLQFSVSRNARGHDIAVWNRERMEFWDTAAKTSSALKAA
eukprot:8075056-Pyramimonas_sp.AAC.1